MRNTLLTLTCVSALLNIESEEEKENGKKKKTIDYSERIGYYEFIDRFCRNSTHSSMKNLVWHSHNFLLPCIAVENILLSALH